MLTSLDSSGAAAAAATATGPEGSFAAHCLTDFVSSGTLAPLTRPTILSGPYWRKWSADKTLELN